MSRRVLQKQSDLLMNENRLEERTEQRNDLVDRQDSFESNFDASTRGDGTSFEYSDYDDQSCNQSQDETYNPALLAFVEDYILGKRLEVLDTCETEDDVASSPSSSFGSETCFTVNNEESSRMNKYRKLSSRSRGWVPKNNESTTIDAPTTTDTVCDTLVTKRSRWESFRRNLSVAKRKGFTNNQSKVSLSSQEKDITANTFSKETSTMANEGGASTQKLTTCDTVPVERSLEKVDQVKMDAGRPTQSNTKLADELFGDKPNNEPSVSTDENILTFEITDDEHINNALTDEKQNLAVSPAHQFNKSTIRSAKLNFTEFPTMIDDSELKLSVHSKGIEIPTIPRFENGPLSPVRSRSDKYFLRGKGRTPRKEKFLAACTGNCNNAKSRPPIPVAPVGQTCENKRFDPVDVGKTILCSKCRAPLSSASLLALDRLDTPEMGVEQNLSFHVDPDTQSLRPNLSNGLEEISEQDDTDLQKDISAILNHFTQGLEGSEGIETQRDVNESDYCCEVTDPNLDQTTNGLQLDSANEDFFPVVDSPTTKIETTIAISSPRQRAVPPTVQIEFKDWRGNDVEIIHESPRKNRLPWIQGMTSSAKLKSPVGPASMKTFVKNQDEMNKEEIIEVEQLFPSSASVCNYEVTSRDSATRVAKSRCFGRESKKLESEGKSVLISLVNMPFSDEDDADDAVSQGNTECCLESSAVSYTSRVLLEEERCEKNDAANANLLPSKLSTHDADEAFILERTMQQINAGEKFIIGHSKASRRVTSPVTLYRFLDFNPCRNELTLDNSYDFMYDPIGLAVCQVPKVDLHTNVVSDKKLGGESQVETKQRNVAFEKAKSNSQKPSSSLKKVLRRLSKQNKVAFKENLVHVFAQESDGENARRELREATFDADLPDEEQPTSGPLASTEATIQGSDKQRSAAKDILKSLLTEKSKAMRVSMYSSDSTRQDSNKSLGSATKMLAAMKAEYVRRRMNNHISQSTTKKVHETKKRNKIQSKLRAEDAAMILQKFKKVQGNEIGIPMEESSDAAIIMQKFKKAQAESIGKVGRRNESEIQEGSGGTVVTSGTKHSQISSLSKLTIEEKKVAHRLLSDIQLLAMIEKKRQSMGQLQSSLKSADIEKSFQLLKSIEASRKNRISQEVESKMASTTDQKATAATDALTNMEAVASQLTDITATKKGNN